MPLLALKSQSESNQAERASLLRCGTSSNLPGLNPTVYATVEIQYDYQLSELTLKSIINVPRDLHNDKQQMRQSSLYISRVQFEEMLLKFGREASQDYLLGSPKLDQLLTLIPFNVFRVLTNNPVAMGWTVEWLECSDSPCP